MNTVRPAQLCARYGTAQAPLPVQSVDLIDEGDLPAAAVRDDARVVVCCGCWRARAIGGAVWWIVHPSEGLDTLMFEAHTFRDGAH